MRHDKEMGVISKAFVVLGKVSKKCQTITKYPDIKQYGNSTLII